MMEDHLHHHHPHHEGHDMMNMMSSHDHHHHLHGNSQEEAQVFDEQGNLKLAGTINSSSDTNNNMFCNKSHMGMIMYMDGRYLNLIKVNSEIAAHTSFLPSIFIQDFAGVSKEEAIAPASTYSFLDGHWTHL